MNSLYMKGGNKLQGNYCCYNEGAHGKILYLRPCQLDTTPSSNNNRKLRKSFKPYG